MITFRKAMGQLREAVSNLSSNHSLDLESFAYGFLLGVGCTDQEACAGCEEFAVFDPKQLRRGDLFRLAGNAVMKAMGWDEVTGSAFVVNARDIHFICDQTGSMEIVYFGDDGEWSKL